MTLAVFVFQASGGMEHVDHIQSIYSM